MTIHVRNWEKFQHPDVARNKHGSVPWVRNYTALLSDPAYTGLTGHRRAILHGIWLEYARSRGQLADDTRTLTRRLDLKVTTADLEALNHAGFIVISASKSQADTAQIRKPRGEERRKETKDQPLPTTRLDVTSEPDGEEPASTGEASNVVDLPRRGLELNGRRATVDELLEFVVKERDGLGG